MTISFQEFTQAYPRLMHFAASGLDDALLAEHGLLSVSALLEQLADAEGRVRWRTVGSLEWRADGWKELNRLQRGGCQWEVEGRGGHRAVLNDQGPLRGLDGLHARGKLGDGLDPGGWVEILNARVYFWADRAMGDRFKEKYDRGRLQAIVLTTRLMPLSLRQKIRISKINGGAIRSGVARGRDTYAPLAAAAFKLKDASEITIESRVTPEELRACGTGDYLKRVLGPS